MTEFGQFGDFVFYGSTVLPLYCLTLFSLTKLSSDLFDICNLLLLMCVRILSLRVVFVLFSLAMLSSLFALLDEPFVDEMLELLGCWIGFTLLSVVLFEK